MTEYKKTMVGYKLWCDECDEWVSELSTKTNRETPNWICCAACGNGLIMVI